MPARVLYAPRDVRCEQVLDPVLALDTDALVRIVASCVCGTDLWPYRNDNPVDEPMRQLFVSNVGIAGGVAPAMDERRAIKSLLRT